jgi:hypothetical protein
MVFDYAKYDLSAILKKVETKEMVLTEQQVGAEPSSRRGAGAQPALQQQTLQQAPGGLQQGAVSVTVVVLPSPSRAEKYGMCITHAPSCTSVQHQSQQQHL